MMEFFVVLLVFFVIWPNWGSWRAMHHLSVSTPKMALLARFCRSSSLIFFLRQGHVAAGVFRGFFRTQKIKAQILGDSLVRIRVAQNEDFVPKFALQTCHSKKKHYVLKGMCPILRETCDESGGKTPKGEVVPLSLRIF